MNKILSGCGGWRLDLSRRRLFRSALAAFVFALSFGTPLAARPAGALPAESRPSSVQADVVRANTIQEVLSLWKPEIHLYVLGDVGLEEDALQELAGWLDGRHWTVLLVGDASGQTYQDSDGITRTGVDAIDFGTGQGIQRQRGFSTQIHPRTHEADGAIFTIVLAQRAFFYTGSAAQDSRGLGEDRFRDNLDRWAIDAMRSSGDIVRAAKDTVGNIDAQLGAAIDQEFQEAGRALASATEQIPQLESLTRELQETSPGGLRKLSIVSADSLRASIEQARATLDEGRAREASRLLAAAVTDMSLVLQQLRLLQESVATARSTFQATAQTLLTLEKTSAAFREAHPELSGPLTRPDLPELRQALARAESALIEDPLWAAKAAEAVRARAVEQVRSIDEYPAVGRALEEARLRLADLEKRERASVARRSLTTARQRLDEGRDLHARAIPGSGEKLEAARSALDAAEQEIYTADRQAARARTVFRMLLLLLVLGLLCTAWSLHRRRRGIKHEAEELLADWRTALDRKLEILFDEMEQRVARFVGPASGVGQRPWTGATLQLAEQIRADVGSLAILWTSANSFLEKAEALIHARGLGALYNLFFPGKYRQGLALLQHEPVPFDPADGLPRLFGQERTWRDDLLGNLASYEPFQKSFPEIVEELNLRATRATEALDLIEKSVVQGPGELERTEERINQAASLQDEIERAGAAEGLFLIPAVFATTLPAATAILARARNLFPTDPVTALQGDGELARRIAVEAFQLAGLMATARREVLSAVDAGMATLREATIATGWIEAERIRLSEEADRLAVQAAEESIAAGIEELAQGLAGMGRRVERAVALSGLLGQTARPEIRRVTAVVQTVRGELGAALRLPADLLLREEGADPSERLADSTRQTETAHDVLGQGDLEAADAALAEAARLTAEAESIVEASRQSLEAHAATVPERRAETVRIEGLLLDREQVLAGIRQTYASSVLFLRAGDPDHPEANGTLADNLDEARAHVVLAHEKLDRAITAHRSGKLLASADLLRQVLGHQELASHRLEEIVERQARLEKTVERNQGLLATLDGRVREDGVSIVGDPRTMQPTLAAFEEGTHQLQRARGAVEANPGDPFLAEEALLAAKAILDRVHDQMAPSDRLLHAEARRSIEAADRQLVAAHDLARRAAGDGIPDSPGIVKAIGRLEELSKAQARVRETLGIAHSDWNTLDREADRIDVEGARSAATLTGELAAAEEAAAAVTGASEKVREATDWSGGYGVTITGEPGSDALAHARNLLMQGRYEEAGQEAQKSFRAADIAIEAAMERVRRLREEEERREEERRRAAEARRRREAQARSFVSSSSGSSSASGGSSSSGSSSSGSGRSSYGGSGSGSGKSGW